MHLNSENKIAEIVSRVLHDEGFVVKKGFNLGKNFFADIVGFTDDKAVVVEIKTRGVQLDQSDLMQVAGYVGALKTIRDFRNREITGCVVASGGTVSSAIPLAKELKIHVIDTVETERIEKEIKNCISSPIRTSV